MTTNMTVPPQARGRDDRFLTVTRPTAFTRFTRVFLPWQLVRFIIINLKMLRIISLSHQSHR